MILIIPTDESKTKEKFDILFFNLHRQKRQILLYTILASSVSPKKPKRNIFLFLYIKTINVKLDFMSSYPILAWVTALQLKAIRPTVGSSNTVSF